MNYTKEMSKSVADYTNPQDKHVRGETVKVAGKIYKKIQRNANVSIPLVSIETLRKGARFGAEDFAAPDAIKANLVSRFGTVDSPEFWSSVGKWVDQGVRVFLEIHTLNQLQGLTESITTKDIRQFAENIQLLQNVMDMSLEDATARLIAKKSEYAAIAMYFENLKSEGKLEFDYSSDEIPEPKWFSGKEETANEAVDGEEEEDEEEDV
jgi:hypothetical protein